MRSLIILRRNCFFCYKPISQRFTTFEPRRSQTFIVDCLSATSFVCRTCVVCLAWRARWLLSDKLSNADICIENSNRASVGLVSALETISPLGELIIFYITSQIWSLARLGRRRRGLLLTRSQIVCQHWLGSLRIHIVAFFFQHGS